MENLTLSLLISQNISLSARLIQEAIENGGEIKECDELSLKANDAKIEDKVESYAIVIEQFEAQEEIIKKKEQELASIRRSLASHRESMKYRLRDAIQRLEVEKLEGHSVYYKLTKVKPRLVIEDEKAISKEYKKEIIETVIDKESILESLNNGFEVEGARLEQGYALRRFLNKGLASEKGKKQLRND